MLKDDSESESNIEEIKNEDKNNINLEIMKKEGENILNLNCKKDQKKKEIYDKDIFNDKSKREICN